MSEHRGDDLPKTTTTELKPSPAPCPLASGCTPDTDVVTGGLKEEPSGGIPQPLE